MHCLFATSLPAYLTTHTSRHLFIQKLGDDGEERLLIPTFLHKTLCKLNWIIHHVAGSPALFRFEANLWNIKLKLIIILKKKQTTIQLSLGFRLCVSF